MRSPVRFSLALIGLTLAAPTILQAQDPASLASGGYGAAAPAPAPAVAPQPAAIPPGMPVATAMPTAAPHKHKRRVICSDCLKKQQAQKMMPPGQIVACAHSKNGVCPACQALLAMPGTVTMGTPTMASASGEAPGQAVASSGGPAPAIGGGSPVAFDPSGMAEPAPIGVIQANYAQSAAMGMPAPAGMARGSEPGRAVATSGMAPGQGGAPEMGPAAGPFQKKSGPFPHPQIIGHLFGFSGMGAAERADAKFRKKEVHAMIRYDNEGTTVNEVPASTVFGKPR